MPGSSTPGSCPATGLLPHRTSRRFLSLRHQSGVREGTGRPGHIIGAVRRNPSTVVVLAHAAPEGLLAAVDRAANVVLVRPDDAAGGGIEAAAGALRRAAGISSPYVLVAADPLTAVADGWRAMWEIPREASPERRGDEEFELRAAEALDAWRAGRFELPDYYLVLAERTAPHQEQPPDFYLGPLRSVRPHRVAVAAAAEPAELAAEVLTVLGSLRHGRWWPSLDETFAAARGFYPGTLAESGSGLATGRSALPTGNSLEFQTPDPEIDSFPRFPLTATEYLLRA